MQATEVFSSVADAVADCALVVGTTAIGNRELRHPLWRLEAASGAIRSQAAGAPVAILFGCEKFGLSNDDMSHCHWLMRIPTVDRTPSMNLGQAVAVCLYELARDAAADSAGPLLRRSMRSGDAEQLTQMLLEVLRESGYMNRIIATSTERKVRRFLRRVNFTSRDAVLLMGFLRQILWKIRVR